MVLDEKILDCPEEPLGRNINIKQIPLRTKKEKRSTTEKAFNSYIFHHEQHVAINMNAKVASGNVSDRNEEHADGKHRKGDHYKAEENLVELANYTQKHT